MLMHCIVYCRNLFQYLIIRPKHQCIYVLDTAGCYKQWSIENESTHMLQFYNAFSEKSFFSYSIDKVYMSIRVCSYRLFY